jgi:hypothetical protein
MRVIVTGDPRFNDYNIVSQALKECWRSDPHNLWIVHSASGRGVDVLAQQVANDNRNIGVYTDAQAIKWRRLGADARREQIASALALGADLVLAFYVNPVRRTPLALEAAKRGFVVRECILGDVAVSPTSDGSRP